MTITAQQFRVDFPEFGDTTKYPEAAVAFWLGLAVLRLNVNRWADMLDHGTELFVAHQLTLATRKGVIAGPIASKGVDKVSVSYDTAAVTLTDAGHWNATTYGIQFWQLQQMAGAGGILV